MTTKLTGSITRRDGSANLYYRRGLPRKVRHRFGGKAEVWRSLGTPDAKEAAARALKVGFDLQRIIDGALSSTPLSSKDFSELAHRFYNEELETYEQRRRALPTATEREEAEAKLFSTDFN